jgi:ABC-2 type transport system permease protein
MISKLIGYCKLVCAYFVLNLKAQVEYRGALTVQILAMFINNCFWLAFWSLFFSRFPVLRGWQINDVITMWCVASCGFGLAHVVFGNGLFLPSLIAKGQLDTWMLYPRALLPHLLLGKMSATAIGDTLFGFFVYVIFVRPDLPHFTLFLLLVASTAMLFSGFSILTGSLGFFVGNAEGISDQCRFALITFSTYPATLFDGKVKLLLLTLIPAAFVSNFPIEALRSLSWQATVCTLAGSFATLGAGVTLFYWGLKRYESGNLMEMRG